MSRHRPGGGYGHHIQSSSPSSTYGTVEQARAEEARRWREALIWCSGSEDFGHGGKAREGWLKLCDPLLRELDGEKTP